MIVAALAIRIGRSQHLLTVDPLTGKPGLVFLTLFIVFSLNLLLGTFNLLPVPPLDGSTGIMVFMTEDRAQRYLDWIRGNSFAMAGLLVGLVVFQRIFPIVQYAAFRIFF
jgi:Zn-dependent protease